MRPRPHLTSNLYHILGTVNNQPALIRVFANTGKDALTLASQTGTNLVILFATREKCNTN